MHFAAEGLDAAFQQSGGGDDGTIELVGDILERTDSCSPLGGFLGAAQLPGPTRLPTARSVRSLLQPGRCRP